MAIRVTCPGCQAALTLADTLRGKKVRCKACEKVLNIPEAKSLVPDDEPEDEAMDEQPVKKKKKKKKNKQGSGILIIGGIAAVFVLLLVGGGVSAFIFLKPDGQKKNPEPIAQVPEAPKEKDNRTPARIVVPGIKEGNPAKKGGAGIVSNIRGAAYRSERQSELKQIGTLYIAFFDEYKGPNRTLDNFLKSIKQSSGPIHDYIKDGYYQMNMNARLDGGSIICYERDIYPQGYQCVMGSGEVRDVPLDELKKILGRDP